MSDEKERPFTERHQGSGARGWNPEAKQTIATPGPGESKGFQGQLADDGGEPPPTPPIPAPEEND